MTTSRSTQASLPANIGPHEPRARRFVGLWWRVERADRMPLLTRLMVGGLVAAAVLALIGGFPFDVPMPMSRWGWVSPTCGLTRGSTAIARGDLALAWHYNPASFLVMGAGLAGAVRLAVGLATGRWLNVGYRPTRMARLLGSFAFFGLWIYQQTNAEFIIHSRT